MLVNGRAHKILLSLLREWATDPHAVDLRDVVLDLDDDDRANELSEGLTSGRSLRGEPKSIVALFLVKVVTAIEVTSRLPEETVVIDGPPLTDENAERDIVLRLLIPSIELDKDMDGRLIDAVWMHPPVRH